MGRNRYTMATPMFLLKGTELQNVFLQFQCSYMAVPSHQASACVVPTDSCDMMIVATAQTP